MGGLEFGDHLPTLHLPYQIFEGAMKDHRFIFWGNWSLYREIPSFKGGFVGRVYEGIETATTGELGVSGDKTLT
jgi:hypothetical protein